MNRTEMEARLQELNDLATKETDRTKVKAYLEEARSLAVKIDDAKALEELDRIAKSHTANSGASLEGGKHEGGTGAEDLATQRGKTLLAGNAITVDVKDVVPSSSTVMTQHTSETVNDTFNPVSSLVDAVNVIHMIGGESFKQGYVKSYEPGDYTAEGAKAATAEPKFGTAEINKTKITAYAEVPEEMVKLAPSAYDQQVESSVVVAEKMKLSKEILIGDGKTGHLTGIFHNPESPSDDIIDRKTDIEVENVGDTLLDDVVFSYGGPENVPGGATLMLNKKDLRAMALLRDANGNKVHKIKALGNAGLIDDTIPYIINSACKAISDPTTQPGDYCMAFGNLKAYDLVYFSNIEVQQSKDYKFAEGQIANKATAFAGGNTVFQNGFVRVKKKGA